MTPHQTQPLARVESLTGLRWFAAFAVFLFHANQMAPIPHLGTLFRFGDAGVTFFYVLSGFVLTWSFRPVVSRKVFYWRRWARVWPMLFLSTVLAWFCFTQPLPEAAKQAGLSLTLVEAWFKPPAIPIANPVAWSVSCEAFFYLAFPFIIGPLLKLRLRWLAVLAALLLFTEWIYWYTARDFIDPANYWVSLSWMIRFPAFRIMEFGLGMIVAAALLKGWRPPLNLWTGLLTIPVSMAIIHYGDNRGWWEPLWTQQGMLPAFLLAVIGVALQDIRGKRSFLRSKPLVALGTWSYSFYLVHLSMIFALMGLASWGALTWSNIWATLAWAAVATLLSGLCYRFFEHPVERWLRARYPRKAAIPEQMRGEPTLLPTTTSS